MNGSPEPLVIREAPVNPPNRFPVLLPVAGFAFAAAHLAFEHFTGGVQSHNLLNRPDLPAISNWLGLVTLPLLVAVVVAVFSFVVRFALRSIGALLRKTRAPQ
jgi:hypothetical protein